MKRILTYCSRSGNDCGSYRTATSMNGAGRHLHHCRDGGVGRMPTMEGVDGLHQVGIVADATRPIHSKEARWDERAPIYGTRRGREPSGRGIRVVGSAADRRKGRGGRIGSHAFVIIVVVLVADVVTAYVEVSGGRGSVILPQPQGIMVVVVVVASGNYIGCRCSPDVESDGVLFVVVNINNNSSGIVNIVIFIVGVIFFIIVVVTDGRIDKSRAARKKAVEKAAG